MNETGDKIDQHMPEVHHATYDAQDVTDDWTGLDTRSSLFYRPTLNLHNYPYAL